MQMMIPRRIFWPNRNDNGDGEDFIESNFISLHLSPNVVRVMKCRRLRLVRQAARVAT